jgi:hypothetical protein
MRRRASSPAATSRIPKPATIRHRVSDDRLPHHPVW